MRQFQAQFQNLSFISNSMLTVTIGTSPGSRQVCRYGGDRNVVCQVPSVVTSSLDTMHANLDTAQLHLTSVTFPKYHHRHLQHYEDLRKFSSLSTSLYRLLSSCCHCFGKSNPIPPCCPGDCVQIVCEVPTPLRSVALLLSDCW